ncbi:MAG: carbohydrate kinase family protein [Candidatus Omnitrophota bacterium]|nr:MAG: carbohydrate kinase family protein [Candidatus Aminicenantes bacterium]UCG35568.1 MAG: carbohydrate kinase family protein [Candidatus Omnitrophota bacterium]
MTKKICVIGNSVADFIASPVEKIPRWGELMDIVNPITMNIGGNGAISAACAARLGLKPYLVSKIGSDELGTRLKSVLDTAKVNTQWLFSDAKTPTSVTLAIVNNEGERMFFHHIGSNAKLTIKDIKKIKLKGMNGLILGSMFILPGIKPKDAAAIVKMAKDNKLPTFLDVAWDPTGKWDIGNVFKNVDFFMPNEEELLHIARTRSLTRAVERLHKKGMDTIIVKQGASGCTVFDFGHRSMHIKAPRVKAVDSTGAGDAFNAGFIYSYLDSGDVRHSAEFATFAASKTVTGIGGARAAPTIKELNQFMKKHSKS